MNMNQSNISYVCRHLYRQAGGYIWLFEKDYFTGNYNKEEMLAWAHEEFEHPNAKPVVQCDLQMNYINTYKNISEAARETGSRRNGINDNCSGRLKTCDGYIWIYESDYEKIRNDSKKLENIANNATVPAMHRKAVIQYDLNMNLISEYSSILDAYKATGVDRKAIKYVCEGRQKSSKGFLWRYKDDVGNCA